MNTPFLLLGILTVVAGQVRWENRTIDCSQGWNHCRGISSQFPCRQEQIPRDHKWASKVDRWSVCPLNCTNANRKTKLSVTLKRPYTGSHCLKYYNYEYSRAANEGADWFAHVSEPCDASLTVWCPLLVGETRT